MAKSEGVVLHLKKSSSCVCLRPSPRHVQTVLKKLVGDIIHAQHNVKLIDRKTKHWCIGNIQA